MITSATTVRTMLREPQPPAAPTGFESPTDARDGGWLGQVPPPAPEPEPATTRSPSPYANPQLAPEPWKDSGSLFPDDPTLFG